MSFPVEMFLRKVGGIWRLGAFPVREIGLLRRFRTESLVTCGSAGVTFPGFADDRAALVTLEIGDSPFTVEAFGETIEFDPGRNEIRMEGLTSPLTYSGERNAVILADTLSIEIYADGGLINANRGIIADRSRGIRFASRRADVSVRMEEIGL